jgi:hypothetical protein
MLSPVERRNYAIQIAMNALEDARNDIRAWVETARRLYAELPTDCPIRPNLDGIEASAGRIVQIDATLAECRKVIAT